MPNVIEQLPGRERSFRANIEQIDGGLDTRTVAHLLADNALAIADNVVFLRNGLASKRPGNGYYGGSPTGKIGTSVAVQSIARFYPDSGSPILLAHSGTQLVSGNDSTGVFTLVNNGMTASSRATFTQMYDPDMSSGGALAAFVCDGVRIPQLYDGTNFVPVQTGGVFLPNGRTGSPITPAYSCDWGFHMVYSGEKTEPSAVYISDALRPERFTGSNFTDSANSSYIPYFPAGRGGTLGKVTGLSTMGPVLIVFFTRGIVVGRNTGSYGALQFQWQILSRSIGCTSPRSIACFDDYTLFFGGDRFYATNGQSVVALPDKLPTVYSRNARTSLPPEIADITALVGVRRGSQYICSYPSVLGQPNDRAIVFDTVANNGFYYGMPPNMNGGAWSRWLGMKLNCAVECRGPGDSLQLFWGSGDTDIVAQHDSGTYDDFGADIRMEVRAKSFFFDRPVDQKMCQELYCIMVFDLTTGSHTLALQPYIQYDQNNAPTNIVNVTVSPNGVTYGSQSYGTFTYHSSGTTVQIPVKSYPQAPSIGYSLGPGLVESSKYSVSIIGFAMEVTLDGPSL